MAYHLGGNFLSGLLDITIIKPLIEYGTGSDLITGERLTETEKSWKLAGVCIDFFTLGQGAMAIKGAGLTGKQVVKAIGKTAAVELMSNAAGYTVSYGCDELGMPLAVTWMLSVFTGCTVSASAGKYILKDANGLVKEINPEEAEDFLKKLVLKEGGMAGIDDISGELKLVDDVAAGTKGMTGAASDASVTELVSAEDAERYIRYIESGSTEGLTSVEIESIKKINNLRILNEINYQDILDISNSKNALESGKSTVVDSPWTFEVVGRMPLQ